MEYLIKNLEKYLRSLDVEQLYKDPGHEKSKNWLAEVTAVLKVGGRHSHKDFKNLSQHIYPSISLGIRKHAAEQIDVFIRQIIAQYKTENKGDFPQFKSIKGNNGQNPVIKNYVNKSILEGFQSKKEPL